MIFARYRDLFEDCPPAFWPWLWLQLVWLLALKEQDGRERLIMVGAWGHVIVLALGDDPYAPKSWTAASMRSYVRPLADMLTAQSPAPQLAPPEQNALAQQSRVCWGAGFPLSLAFAGLGLRRFPTGLSPPLSCQP